MWYFTTGIIVAILAAIMIHLYPPGVYEEVETEGDLLFYAACTLLVVLLIGLVWPFWICMLPFYRIIQKKLKKDLEAEGKK